MLHYNLLKVLQECADNDAQLSSRCRTSTAAAAAKASEHCTIMTGTDFKNTFPPTNITQNPVLYKCASQKFFPPLPLKAT